MNTQQWPSEYTRRTTSNWVKNVSRPEEGDCHASGLATRQREWDEAKATQDRIDEKAVRIRAEREEQAAAARERAQEKQRARSEAQEQELVAQLKRAYLRAPGATEETFAAALPELLETERRKLAAEGETAAQRAQAGLYTRF